MHPRTPFISIGTRGTSFPVDLRTLPKPLRIGKQSVPNPSKKGSIEYENWEKSHAWVSRKGESFEIYTLGSALKLNKVKAVQLFWISSGKLHEGICYLRYDWSLKDGQPERVAVISDTWTEGRVELKRVNDGRNVSLVASLLLALQDVCKPKVKQVLGV